MDDVDERRASVMHSMYDGVAPGTIGLEYGRQHPAASRIATITMGLKIKSALRHFLNKLKFEDEEELVAESGFTLDEQAVLIPPLSPGERTLERRSSIVQSMNEYMFRRLLVEDKIKAGVVHGVAIDGIDVPVELQADLEMYDDEHQRMRSEIKRSTLFAKEVRRIWAFLAPQNFLSKDQFITFFTKSALILVPPPVDRESVLRTATEDWARDLERAQELKMTNESGDELSFDAFYKSIYELVDTWCETAEIAEYMDMIRRLIGGATEMDSTGAMCWRSDFDIVYDRHFSMAGDDNEEVDDAEAVQEAYEAQDAQDSQQGQGVNGPQAAQGLLNADGDQGAEGAQVIESTTGGGERGAHSAQGSQESYDPRDLIEAQDGPGLQEALDSKIGQGIFADGAQAGQDANGAQGYEGAEGTESIGGAQGSRSADREGEHQIHGTQEAQRALRSYEAQNRQEAQNPRTTQEDHGDSRVYVARSADETQEARGLKEAYGIDVQTTEEGPRDSHGALGTRDAQVLHGTNGTQGTREVSVAQGATEDKKVREAREVKEKSTRKPHEANPQELVIEEDNDPSSLQHLAHKRKQKKKENLLPVEKVNDLIACIFQAKQKADLWAIKSGNDALLIRFDRFVLRYFMLQVGMLGAARRHLRFFVRSAVKHLLASSNGRDELPRIYLFCCLTGLESPTPDAEFNPRLSAEYFQPALRSLFPNPMTIEAGFLVRKSKRNTTVPTAPFKELEKACIPLTLQAMVGGNNAIEHYRRDLGPHTVKGSCNLDLGLSFALSLWVFMDAMRGMRERAALRTLQRWFHRRQAKAANMAEMNEPVQVASVPNEASKNGIEIGILQPTAAVPPSPRLTERLNEARSLDARLNSGGAPQMEVARTPT